MRAAFPLFLALAVPVALVALVARPATPDPLSRASLEELLQRPLDARAGDPRSGDPRPGASEPEPVPRTFWRALLELPAATRDERGTTLRLGRVLADPTGARGSAESAGELLWLPVSGPEGEPGVPLWRAVVDGPALVRTDAGLTLPIHGCRHSADAASAPALEDSYFARLSLARALGRIVATEVDGEPITVTGEQFPVKGGVNFEVQFAGGTQTVEVTFSGPDSPRLRVSRTGCPGPPNDARARANLLSALRALAAGDASLGPLVVEGETEPAPDGVDVRLELLGERFSVTATGGGTRLSAHLDLPSGPP